MKTRRIVAGIVLAGAVGLLAGCNLHERMEWAPDGSRAAVKTGNALRLCDTNGVLSGEGPANVTGFSWLPDSSALLYVREIVCTNWAEVVPLIEPEERARIESMAKLAAGVVEMAVRGDEEIVKKILAAGADLQLMQLMLLCARDTDGERLRDAMGTNQWAEGDLKAPVRELGVVPVGNGTFGERRVLARSAQGIGRARVSPTQPVVAYVRDGQLAVLPLGGEGTNVVRSSGASVADLDWMPDGKSLVIVQSRRIEEIKANFGMIVRVNVEAGNGLPLSLGEERVLALALLGDRQAVRCLPGGRVLFAGAAVGLPAAVQALPRTQLFLIDTALAENARPVAVPCAADALPMDAGYFVPSPDGRRVALAEPGSDTVAVLTLADGAVELVSPNRGRKSRTLPCWRGPDELFFAALPNADARRSEMMRFRNGGTEVFSAGWPDGAVGGLLDK